MGINVNFKNYDFCVSGQIKDTQTSAFNERYIKFGLVSLEGKRSNGTGQFETSAESRVTTDLSAYVSVKASINRTDSAIAQVNGIWEFEPLSPISQIGIKYSFTGGLISSAYGIILLIDKINNEIIYSNFTEKKSGDYGQSGTWEIAYDFQLDHEYRLQIVTKAFTEYDQVSLQMGTTDIDTAQELSVPPGPPSSLKIDKG